MKQIEGRARRTLKDNKPVAAIGLFGSIAILVYIFASRGQIPSNILFGVATMFGAFAGGNIMILLRDID